MARRNQYSYSKRQRELKKKKKQEEKRARKRAKAEGLDPDAPDTSSTLDGLPTEGASPEEE